MSDYPLFPEQPLNPPEEKVHKEAAWHRRHNTALRGTLYHPDSLAAKWLHFPQSPKSPYENLPDNYINRIGVPFR